LQHHRSVEFIVTRDIRTKRSGLPQVILYLAITMTAAGIFIYGLGWTEFVRVWDNMLARPGWSLTFRFLLQPIMSCAVAARDGVKDARAGRPPFLWSALTDRETGSGWLREAIAATGKIFLLAVALDAVDQYIILTAVHPIEALIVAFSLAVIPYILLRGPAGRIAEWWMTRGAAGDRSR
jgi:hypothetical protein